MDKVIVDRDNRWLEYRLAHIWANYFSDITSPNEVKISYGRRSRTRLGSIRLDHGVSMITITRYFADLAVPEYVVDTTIAHELVHYAHGFHSPHAQRYRHPHRGGIVDTELHHRQMGKQLMLQQAWLKNVWPSIIGPLPRKKRRRYFKLPFLPAYRRREV